MSSPSTRKKQSKPRRTQLDRTEEALAALRKAALELIVRDGVDKLKLTDVASRAGYSRSIVNYHFGTKTDLLIDLLDHNAVRGEMLFAHDDTRGLATITRTFDNLIYMFEQRPDEIRGLLLLIYEASCSSTLDLHERVQEYNRAIRKLMATAVEEHLTDSGSAQSGCGEEEAKMILSLIRGACIQWLAEGEAFGLVAVLQRMKSRVLALLAQL